MRSGGTVTRGRSSGIPAIWGATSYDLFFLQGYVQAGDRLFQMDMSRDSVRDAGRAFMGQAALSSDVQFRTFGLRRAGTLDCGAHRRNARGSRRLRGGGECRYSTHTVRRVRRPIP